MSVGLMPSDSTPTPGEFALPDPHTPVDSAGDFALPDPPAPVDTAFTEEQLIAIERRDGDLLLDAGAGSGKTSERAE